MFKMHTNTSRMSCVININIGRDILVKKHNKSQYCTKRKCLLKIYAIHPMLDTSEGAACFWWMCVCVRRLTGFTIYLFYKSPLANTPAWCLCWEEVEYLSSTQTSILPRPVWNTQNCSVSGWFDQRQRGQKVFLSVKQAILIHPKNSSVIRWLSVKH